MTLHYECEGTGDTLVLIAGYTCDLGQWALVRPLLARHFSLLLIDNRGVGRSDTPEGPYSVRLMAEDVAVLMDRLGVGRAHVLGHSMGGAIAQELARHRPELVGRLILANTLVRLPATTAAAFRWLLRLREAGIPPRTLIEGALPWVHSRHFLADPANAEAAIESFLANPFPQSLDGQRRQLDALLDFDSGPWFPQITARTLVLAGEEDICTGVADSGQLAQGIAGARLVTLPGAAHVPFLENPGEFADVVRAFLCER
jgi:pimeloyl-ACP methyl ester carboxylesterase